jgi:hypothetical protein
VDIPVFTPAPLLGATTVPGFAIGTLFAAAASPPLCAPAAPAAAPTPVVLKYWWLAAIQEKSFVRSFN